MNVSITRLVFRRMMAMKTNLEACRQLAIAFLNFEPEPIKEIPFMITHPFFDGRHVALGCELIDIVESPDKFQEIKLEIQAQIESKDLNFIFYRMLPKYHLAYLKFAKPYMSKSDFEERLAMAWITSENPNQDVNVSIGKFIQWFKAADKSNLMTAAELEYYNALPEVITVYRGIAVGRAEKQGLSWTCNYNTAEWFANRFNYGDKKGYVIKGQIAKADVFAYFNRRNEDELVCNSRKIKITE